MDQRWALEKLAKVLALSLESSSLRSSISSVCCLARSKSLRLMAICSNFSLASWSPSPFSPTIISLIFSLCLTVSSRFHFCVSRVLFSLRMVSISAATFSIFFSKRAMRLSPSFLTFSICSLRDLISLSLSLVSFLARATCISFFTFSIWISLIIAFRRSISYSFFYRFSVYSVTLILQVFICYITLIFSSAFARIFVFFYSISPREISSAESSSGTGLSPFSYTCPCLIRTCTSRSDYARRRKSFIAPNSASSRCSYSYPWACRYSESASVYFKTLTRASSSASSLRMLNLASRIWSREASGMSQVCCRTLISAVKKWKSRAFSAARFLDQTSLSGSSGTSRFLQEGSDYNSFSSSSLRFLKLEVYSSKMLFSMVLILDSISPSFLESNAACFASFWCSTSSSSASSACRCSSMRCSLAFDPSRRCCSCPCLDCCSRTTPMLRQSRVQQSSCSSMRQSYSRRRLISANSFSSQRSMMSSISWRSLRSSASSFLTIRSFSSSAFWRFCSNSFSFAFSSSLISSNGFSIHFSRSTVTSSTDVFFSSSVPPIIFPNARIEASSSASFRSRSSSFRRSRSAFSRSSLERQRLKGISLGVTSRTNSLVSSMFFLPRRVSLAFLSSSVISSMRLFLSLMISFWFWRSLSTFSNSRLKASLIRSIICFMRRIWFRLALSENSSKELQSSDHSSSLKTYSACSACTATSSSFFFFPFSYFFSSRSAAAMISGWTTPPLTTLRLMQKSQLFSVVRRFCSFFWARRRSNRIWRVRLSSLLILRSWQLKTMKLFFSPFTAFNCTYIRSQVICFSL